MTSSVRLPMAASARCFFFSLYLTRILSVFSASCFACERQTHGCDHGTNALISQGLALVGVALVGMALVGVALVGVALVALAERRAGPLTWKREISQSASETM